MIAHFRTFPRRRRVVRFDDVGRALVCDRRTGELVVAADVPGFECVVDGADQLAIIPAPPGLTLALRCEDGETIEHALVGWDSETGLPAYLEVDGTLELLTEDERHRWKPYAA